MCFIKVHIIKKVKWQLFTISTKMFFSYFEEMWKFKDDHFLGYLIYNVLRRHIVLNDIWRCGKMEFITRCLGVYLLHYYCELEVMYQKSCYKKLSTPSTKSSVKTLTLEKGQVGPWDSNTFPQVTKNARIWIPTFNTP